MQATETKERPILFNADMVRAVLDGRKTQTRRVVTQRNSSVDASLWKRLEWDDAKIPEHFGPNYADDSLRQMNIANADYLHVAARPHPDDPQDDEGLWTRWRVCCEYQPGDRLYVRESCQAFELESGLDAVIYPADGAVVPIANTREAADRWGDLYHYGNRRGSTVPSIHMPRWASRILLEVTDVRVERVQDIREDDAVAEGAFLGRCPCGEMQRKPRTPIEGAFRQTGCHIHGTEFAHLWDSINARKPGCSWSDNPWCWAVSFKVLKGATNA